MDVLVLADLTRSEELGKYMLRGKTSKLKNNLKKPLLS